MDAKTVQRKKNYVVYLKAVSYTHLDVYKRQVLDKIAAHLYEKENITGKEFMKIYRELKGIPEPEEENVAKQGSSVDFRVGEEVTHTVDLNKATSEKEESEEEDPNKENSREEDFEQETDV